MAKIYILVNIFLKIYIINIIFAQFKKKKLEYNYAICTKNK